MDELIAIMQGVLFELQEMNAKLDAISGVGSYSISDVCNELDSMKDGINEITANGVYTLQDVCSKLDSVELSIDLK